jgi:hypothetical protein
VVQTASLLKHFIDEKVEVRLVVGDEVGAFGSRTEHLYRCLRRLALVSPIAEYSKEDSVTVEAASKLGVDRGAAEHDYAILLTAAAPGSIPAAVWRTSHVIYL